MQKSSTNRLVRLLHVEKQISNTSIRLLAAGNDLIGGENEAVGSLVAKLGGEDVVGLDDLVDVVDAGAGSLVDGLADVSGGEGGAKDGADGGGSATRKRQQLSVLGRDVGAGVAVSWVCQSLKIWHPKRRGQLTSHEHLRIRVPVHVELDALRRLGGAEEGSQSSGFRGIKSRTTFVVFCARVCGGTTRDIPLVSPIAVDVVANAGAARGGLAVLAP
jgi:hypothetical protein